MWHIWSHNFLLLEAFWSKLHHHVHVLKQTLPLTGLSSTQMNKSGILTLARLIIWLITWATWISKVMIFLALIKFALEMVQVWKSLILELHLYLPLLLLLFLITFLSYHKLPKIFNLFKNLLKTIMFILIFIVCSFLLRITRGTSYIKALCLMVSIPSLNHFNTIFYLQFLVLGSLSTTNIAVLVMPPMILLNMFCTIIIYMLALLWDIIFVLSVQWFKAIIYPFLLLFHLFLDLLN